jgi:hypothetical protein
MNPTMITCPSCGAEIPLSDALQEQFRHENEARLKALAGEAQQKARSDFGVEKQFLEARLADEPRKREEAQQAELALRLERVRSRIALRSSISKWRVGSTASGSASPSSRS